jgi:G3E family GTPase
MDSVICLVDALHFIPTAAEEEAVHRQVAIADVVLLNKAGDQEPGILEKTRQQIRRLNPNCEIMETRYAGIGGRKLLDRFDYRPDHVQSFTMDVFREDLAAEPEPGYAGAEPGHMNRRKAGKHHITSYSFRMDGTFDAEKFSCWIEYFLYINQANLFRLKGILNFDRNPHRMILQSVRSSYLLEDGDYWDAGEDRENRMVFIGKDLPCREIREALESLMI